MTGQLERNCPKIVSIMDAQDSIWDAQINEKV